MPLPKRTKRMLQLAHPTDVAEAYDPQVHPFKRSRELRAAETKAEYALWWALRKKQIQGLRFRRQYPVGPYFPDFVCLPVRLAIEVDGHSHANPDEFVYEDTRTAWLERHGYKVLRFSNSAVLTNMERVIADIERAVLERKRSTD